MNRLLQKQMKTTLALLEEFLRDCEAAAKEIRATDPSLTHWGMWIFERDSDTPLYLAVISTPHGAPAVFRHMRVTLDTKNSRVITAATVLPARIPFLDFPLPDGFKPAAMRDGSQPFKKLRIPA